MKNRKARPTWAVCPSTNHSAGIDLITNDEPTRFESGPDGLIAHTKVGRSIAAGLVIEATGRVANIPVLAGDHAGVEHSSRGIVVDEFMRSVSNPNVYAIGDCIAGSRMLAPVADEEGKVAAHNILNGATKAADLAEFMWAYPTYTSDLKYMVK
jgi:glutathione reductase (NADPH)